MMTTVSYHSDDPTSNTYFNMFNALHEYSTSKLFLDQIVLD